MKRQLTSRQREVLDTISSFIAKKGFAPSIREIGALLEISSLRGVTIHLDALERKGWIQRESTSRSIRILAPTPTNPTSDESRSIPVLGTIAAGIPLLAVENVETYVNIPTAIPGSEEDLFGLHVKGQSMIGDHILDGDIIIIRSQAVAENGDIVAALIDDEATVKRLDLRSQPPRLLASNPDYSPIELQADNSKILGKVVGLIRSYQPT